LEKTGYHIRASGRVQGVGYRYYCAGRARANNLSGYVMNLEDGDVEMEVFGAESDIEKFIVEVTAQGMGFNVESLIKEKLAYSEKHDGFIIRNS